MLEQHQHARVSASPKCHLWVWDMAVVPDVCRVARARVSPNIIHLNSLLSSSFMASLHSPSPDKQIQSKNEVSQEVVETRGNHHPHCYTILHHLLHGSSLIDFQ